MAFPKQNTAPTQANSNQKRTAAAYMNITIKDSEGNDRKIGGLPLYADNGTHFGIMEKYQATVAATKGSKEAKFTFELSYDINENNVGKKVQF